MSLPFWRVFKVAPVSDTKSTETFSWAFNMFSGVLTYCRWFVEEHLDLDQTQLCKPSDGLADRRN